MSIATRVYTLLFGKYLGSDEFGNRYYTCNGNGKKRWVIYKGMAEASKVPPAFHGWLHKSTDIFPSDPARTKTYQWQKDHSPNLTGTNLAYFPPGYPAKGGQRNKATGDYIPWNPEDKAK